MFAGHYQLIPVGGAEIAEVGERSSIVSQHLDNSARRRRPHHLRRFEDGQRTAQAAQVQSGVSSGF